MAKEQDSFVAGKESAQDEVTMASGDTLGAVGRGKASLVAHGNGGEATIVLAGTYHVPDICQNLMSVGKVDKAGGGVLFAKGHCYIYGDAEAVAPPEVVALADASGELTRQGQ